MKLWFGKLLILGVILCVGVVQAQETLCPELVEEALSSVDEVCTDLKRNEACYGHDSLQAELFTDAEFDTVGDIAKLLDIQRLTLSGMDVGNSVWGVTLIAMQANLPDTLPGQNVSFVLFGDVSIESEIDEPSGFEDEEDGFTAPMQAFYFTSGIGDAACTEAPQSGLMIQTPDGVGEVMFRANEVEIVLGSTAFLQAEPGGEMIVSVIEGQATLTAFGVSVTAVAGTQVRIELDADGAVVAVPGQPQAYDMDDLMALPLILLEREIEIALPLEALDADDSSGDSSSTGDDSSETSVPDGDATSTDDTSTGVLQASADGGTALAECSGAGEGTYTINVDNQSSRTLLFFWVDYSCEHVQYGIINPGTTFQQGTFPTHPWILTDAETGATVFGPWGATSASDFTITVTE